MQGEDFSWQKPQTFILSVGNNSQGHSYTRWLWKGLADYRMHVKESTWANLNGTQWLQSLQSLKPSSKCSWSVWHSHRVWNYAFNSLSLAFGKNSPSRCMWSRSAPPRLGKDCEAECGAAVTKANVILGWVRLGYLTERRAVLMLCWDLTERPLDYSYTFVVPHLQDR